MLETLWHVIGLCPCRHVHLDLALVWPALAACAAVVPLYARSALRRFTGR